MKDHIEITLVENKVMFETDSKVFIFQNLMKKLFQYVPKQEMHFENDTVSLHNLPGFNDRAFVQFGREEIRKAYVVVTANGQYKLKVKSGNFWNKV